MELRADGHKVELPLRVDVLVDLDRLEPAGRALDAGGGVEGEAGNHLARSGAGKPPPSLPCGSVEPTPLAALSASSSHSTFAAASAVICPGPS
jgi:hypothetical protein